MVFNSQLFILLFLPLTLVCCYTLAPKTTARIWPLVVASLIFYGYWDFGGFRVPGLAVTEGVA